MQPRVLIFHTLDWPNAARLAIAFRAADCSVSALCRKGYPLSMASCVDQVRTLDLFSPLKSLRSAIRAAKPDFIVPCDDTAVTHLHRLHAEETKSSSGIPTPIAALIERSLGDPSSFQRLERRSELNLIAAETDVLLPETVLLRTLDDLKNFAERVGFPVVLKTDYSWGGEGVAIAENLAGAEKCFRNFSRRPSLLNVVKRLVVNRDPNLLHKRFSSPKPVITAQRFIRGKLANTASACWNGKTVAMLNVEVVASFGKTGSSTVVHPVENPQMRCTAERIIRHLGLSGFCGFDFIIEDQTERAYLLEINPRGTQINHLVLGTGRDLPGALRARIANEPEREAALVTSAQTIALFPQEWKRDPQSSFLTSSYQDVPYEEPALIPMLQASTASMGRRRFARTPC